MAHQPCRSQGDQKCAFAFSAEDPFESAFEKASEKLLGPLCSIFARTDTVLPSSDLAREAPLHACSISGKQIIPQQRARRASCQFASSSFTFTARSDGLHDENANDMTQRNMSETCSKSSRSSSTCASAPEPTALRERRHNVVVQTNGDKMSVTNLQKIVTEATCKCSMASLTFAPINKLYRDEDTIQEINHPSAQQLLSHPIALLSYVPKDISLFLAGAVAGATAKTVTAPLDRIKLLMQVYRVRTTQEIRKKSIGFLEAAAQIGNEGGVQSYWKGNWPQVIRVVPYSACQLLSYEIYKKLFKGKNKQLSLAGRLAAGACAGMTSTLVTYPLDVLRLRLAVDPACKTMVQVASSMLREEGLSSFYRGLGPSLFGIAPYIALNFCAFDLIKKSLPEETRKTPTASFLTAFLSASLATTMCYPLDTVRRQLQMKGAPYFTVFDAIPGIIASDGVLGLYRGFVPNALKNLPNSSIRLTTFDAAKNLIDASQQEFQRLLDIRRGVTKAAVDFHR